jgi:hypothetical protein
MSPRLAPRSRQPLGALASALGAVLLLALAFALPTAAHAGRSCEARLPKAVSVQRSFTLADHAAKALDASGAQVVVLARVGQDLSKYGLRWSHLGLAYREPSFAADGSPGPGAWRVAHKLNACGTAQADVYRQGLAEFFLDDMFEYAASFAVPTPEVQARLLPLLRDNPQLGMFHTRAYSMVAYPWAQTYQQSNQWALETLALSQEPAATTRERAQAWLRLKGYEPTGLHLSALARLGARVSAANVSFDDHPNEKRFSDRIETVTVDSVFRWMEHAGLASAPQVVR